MIDIFLQFSSIDMGGIKELVLEGLPKSSELDFRFDENVL